MKKGARFGSRGQVTIFIIIGIIIVAAGILIYSFYPQIKSTIGTGEENPPSYIQTCVENDLKDAVNKVSLQGGSISPENYLLYQNNKIEYLCYTNEYYRNCIIQQPMLTQHIESEIKKAIQNTVDACFNSLKTSYQKKGYDVTLNPGDETVALLPQRITATFNYTLVLTKGSTDRYDSFVVSLNNNLYELASIANSIIGFETALGDAEVTTYMTYYHNLKVEKIQRDYDGKIYVLTDRETGNKFQFASRSQMWPPGVEKPTT